MAARCDILAPEVLSTYVTNQRQRARLSYVSERLGTVQQQRFEVCCRLQREFDPRDLRHVSALLAEFKTLSACEEGLKRTDG